MIFGKKVSHYYFLNILVAAVATGGCAKFENLTLKKIFFYIIANCKFNCKFNFFLI
jgi:tetrahydromethanopterin S-methyltransferase subunit A